MQWPDARSPGAVTAPRSPGTGPGTGPGSRGGAACRRRSPLLLVWQKRRQIKERWAVPPGPTAPRAQPAAPLRAPAPHREPAAHTRVGGRPRSHRQAVRRGGPAEPPTRRVTRAPRSWVHPAALRDTNAQWPRHWEGGPPPSEGGQDPHDRGPTQSPSIRHSAPVTARGVAGTVSHSQDAQDSPRAGPTRGCLG